eukprot:2609126-Pyramimonas_sp.AAC.1
MSSTWIFALLWPRRNAPTSRAKKRSASASSTIVAHTRLKLAQWSGPLSGHHWLLEPEVKGGD